MKRLDTFLEGLLDKSNKSKLINIDIMDSNELATVFPHRTSLGQDIYLPLKNGLCMMHGFGRSSKRYSPGIDIFMKIKKVLYRFNVIVNGLDQQTNEYRPHEISARACTEGEMLNFHKNGYLWKVDMEEVKSFLIGQFKLYDKAEVDGDLNDYKQFEKWLGVKLDIKH